MSASLSDGEALYFGGKRNMKDQKKILVKIAALAAAVLLLFVLWKVFSPKPAAGAKAYIVEVVDKEGQKKTWSGKTDAEYLKDLMEEITVDGFSYEGYDSDYGFYITSVDGVPADYNTDGAYWAIFVNGEYGSYGADQQPVTDGDTYRFEYTSGF